MKGLRQPVAEIQRLENIPFLIEFKLNRKREIQVKLSNKHNLCVKNNQNQNK